jgi:acyl-CoA synthetase (NDP forming)
MTFYESINNHDEKTMKTHVDHPAIRRLFSRIESEGRRYLFEYEVYDLIRHIGSETVPRYLVLKKEDELDPEKLRRIPGDKVVIKIVSPTIFHKSDIGGVRIVRKRHGEV